MLLGEGTRKVGEACWSHAQCTRDQPNSHCHALVCTCDSGFHNTNGKCSRNIWEEVGLHQWELIAVTFVLTLMLFAFFVGTVYFIVSKIVRFRRTSPAETLAPADSFKVQSSQKKQNGPEGSAKNPRAYETKLVDSSTVESQLVDEGFNNDSNASTLTISQISEPVRFIMPLDYRSNRSSDTESWQSSRRSSNSQQWMRQPAVYGQYRLTRAWSTSPSYDDSDEWFQPNRNHIRRFGPQSPSGTTRLPLLLRASTFSESDESP